MSRGRRGRAVCVFSARRRIEFDELLPRRGRAGRVYRGACGGTPDRVTSLGRYQDAAQHGAPAHGQGLHHRPSRACVLQLSKSAAKQQRASWTRPATPKELRRSGVVSPHGARPLAWRNTPSRTVQGRGRPGYVCNWGGHTARVGEGTPRILRGPAISYHGAKRSLLRFSNSSRLDKKSPAHRAVHCAPAGHRARGRGDDRGSVLGTRAPERWRVTRTALTIR